MEQITKEELLDVTGKFKLGNHIEVVSVEPYGSGHINDTFRLEVKEDGKEKLYILQRMNTVSYTHLTLPTIYSV